MSSTPSASVATTATTARLRLLLPGVAIAALLALLALASPRAGADAAALSAAVAQHGGHGGAVATTRLPRTAAQLALHDQMRRLWEDHVTWTRLAIVTFADGSAGFSPTAARLLQNQDDIGDAIKPFYGDAAGEQLTALLREHITIAVDVLEAAKAGDTAAFTSAKARWYANADDIADLLATANPRFWPQTTMRDGMREHLDQTLAEAAHELGGDHAASVADYEAVHTHILALADLLSSGIIGQFPGRVG
jgi:hypothetical protein